MNRTMQAKSVKLRAQKRRYPRRMDLDKRGPRPNLAVLADYSQRAKGLMVEDRWLMLDNGQIVLESEVPVVNAHLSAKSEIDDKLIAQKWGAPKYIEVCSTPIERDRLYFNSKKNKVVIQQVRLLNKVFRISEAFSSLADAQYALAMDIVPWRIEKRYTNQPA